MPDKTPALTPPTYQAISRMLARIADAFRTIDEILDLDETIPQARAAIRAADPDYPGDYQTHPSLINYRRAIRATRRAIGGTLAIDGNKRPDNDDV